MRRAPTWIQAVVRPLACAAIAVRFVATRLRSVAWGWRGLLACAAIAVLFVATGWRLGWTKLLWVVSGGGLCALVLLAWERMHRALKLLRGLDEVSRSSSSELSEVASRLAQLVEEKRYLAQGDAHSIVEAVKRLEHELKDLRKQVQEFRDQIGRFPASALPSVESMGAATQPYLGRTEPGAGGHIRAKGVTDLPQAIELWKQNGGPTDCRLWRHAEALRDLEKRLFQQEEPDDALLNDVARYLYGVSSEHESESPLDDVPLELVATLGGAVAASKCRLLRAFESRYRLRVMSILEGETPYQPRLHERVPELDISTNNPEKHERIARVYRHGFVRTDSGDVYRRALVAAYQLESGTPVNAAASSSSPDQWGDGMWDRLARDIVQALGSEPSSPHRQGLLAEAAKKGLDWREVQIGNTSEWVPGNELETMPSSFAEGLRAAGVRWKGQLKVRPRAAEQP